MKYVKPTKLHTGSVGDLMGWIEKLVNVAHPDNGVEYWAPAVSEYDKAASPNLRSNDKLPQRVQHVAAYVHHGRSEGHILQVGLKDADGQFRFVCWAKVFGKKAEIWALAQTLSDALESIFLYEEQSILPDLWEKLPTTHRYVRHTSLTGRYELITSPGAGGTVTVVLRHEFGREIDSQSFKAGYLAQAYTADWMSILEQQDKVTVSYTDTTLQAA